MPEISKTADQALLILAAIVSDGPLSAQDVAQSLNLNRTVTHRLLTTLQLRGFVRKHGSSYSAGPFFLRAAQQAWPAVFSDAKFILREMADLHGETVLLTVADGDSAVAIDQAIGERHPVRIGYHIGEKHPLARGASGYAILAYIETRQLDRVLSNHDAPDAVRAELDRVRERGYAISRDELHAGICGVAVPILDSEGFALASLAVIAPSEREQDALALLPHLRSAAARFERNLRSS